MASSLIDPMNEYLYQVAEDIGREEYLDMIGLCGGSKPLICKRDREILANGENGHWSAMQLFNKLIEQGYLSETMPDILIKLLRSIKRDNLADQVNNRFQEGF